MTQIQQLIIAHLDIWTSAETEKKSGRGRSSGNGDTIYGIKKLRELILELAVRGKLVPQDPNDEPASELLKRIQAEKARLVKEGKIKKEKAATPISDDEKPFELPHNWQWVRLGDISSTVQYGYTASADHQSSEIHFLRITDIQDDKVDWLSVPGCDISEADYESYALQNDDLVIARTGGTIGKSYLVSGLDKKAVFASYLIRIGNLSSTSAAYKKVYMGSMLYWRQLYANSMGTGQPNVNGTALHGLIATLPPLAEQHRIVAKVDELMALCDQLETQHNNASDAHEKLVTHLLGTLTQSQNGDDFAANWQRIAEHFDTLFTTEHSIVTLKQTLLQLAVMGKLVPQDPNDEPASELLKRIQAEKAKLIAAGKIKKEKPLPPISDEEKPFDLPVGWEWTRIGSQVLFSDAGWSPSCEGRPREGSEWGVLKVSAVSWGKFMPEENKALPTHLEPRLECAVESGDFLVSRANTAELVARSVLVDVAPKNLMLSDKIVRLKLSSFCYSAYINLANSCGFSRDYYARVAGGTSSSMKNVSREQILQLIFPLPPFAEQQRIVAKFEKLMSLCDYLKSRITESSQLKQKLADALVTQALTA